MGDFFLSCIDNKVVDFFQAVPRYLGPYSFSASDFWKSPHRYNRLIPIDYRLGRTKVERTSDTTIFKNISPHKRS